MNTHWMGQAIAARPSEEFSAGIRVLWKRLSALLSRALAGRQHGAASALRVEERLSLGPKKMLFLVECSGRQFLVAAGAETIVSMIEVSSAPSEHKAAGKRRKLPAGTSQQQESR